MSEEIKEEVKEEEKKVEVTECDGNCESCEVEDCLAAGYDFEPIHKKGTIANIFSIVCKVLALLFLVVGTYEYVLSIVSYVQTYAEMPSIIEVIYSWVNEVCFVAAVFFGIGEITNLVNRVKESIMY